MKRTIALATLALGMSIGFTTHVSAQTTAVRVTVPFDFAVGNHVLPQGTYRIGTDGDLLAFNGRDQKASLFTVAPRGEASKDGKSVLVFDNIEGQYFLRKIVTTSARISADFPMSKLEKNSRESIGTRSVYAETSSR